MNTRLILTVVISLALAAFAVKYANDWLTNRQATNQKATDLPVVVAAATDIPAGTKMEAMHLQMVGLPEESIPIGSYDAVDALIEQVASQTIYQGEILIKKRVAERPGTSALAAILPKGKRAITVPVNMVAGVSGFILPGSRVDLITSGGGRANTILQNIKVLAIGQTITREKNDPVTVSAVTLEVDPVQAEIIAKAGNLRLTLRNPMDDVLVEAPTPAAETPPAPVVDEMEPYKLYAIDVVRGTAVSTTSVDY